MNRTTIHLLSSPFAISANDNRFPLGLVAIQTDPNQRPRHHSTPLPNAALQGAELSVGKLAGEFLV
jgi:hypothetical protein